MQTRQSKITRQWTKTRPCWITQHSNSASVV